jgi:cytoskeletal protein RodZ
MGERFRETLGQYLRQARESRRISLEEVSRTTRISPPFLIALEKNDFDFFSQHDFIPGFLKLYARYLGLDGQEILQRYEFQSEMHHQEKAFQQLPLFVDLNIPVEKARERKWFPGQRLRKRIISLVLLLTILGLLLYIHLVPEKNRHPETLRPALSQNIGQKDPVEKMAVIHPVGPAEKEGLPLKTQDGPGINTSPEEHRSKMKEEPPGQVIPPIPEKMKVIGNRDSKRYHLPGMKYYDEVLTYHRVEFSSEKEAIRAGYHKAPK